MIAVAQWLRNWVFNKEATGSNAGFFMHLFYLTVTVLLEYNHISSLVQSD